MEVENVASTGFVGLNDGSCSKTLYTLEQLVGEGSRLRFRLHRWDGRYVYASCSTSLLYFSLQLQRPNAYR